MSISSIGLTKYLIQDINKYGRNSFSRWICNGIAMLLLWCRDWYVSVAHDANPMSQSMIRISCKTSLKKKTNVNLNNITEINVIKLIFNKKAISLLVFHLLSISLQWQVYWLHLRVWVGWIVEGHANRYYSQSALVFVLPTFWKQIYSRFFLPLDLEIKAILVVHLIH